MSATTVSEPDLVDPIKGVLAFRIGLVDETSLGGPLYDVAEIHCSVAVFTLATLALGEELFRLLAEVALCVVCRSELALALSSTTLHPEPEVHLCLYLPAGRPQ